MLMYHSMHEVRNVFPQRYSSDMEERVIAKMYGLGYHRISWKPCMPTCKPQPILIYLEVCTPCTFHRMCVYNSLNVLPMMLGVLMVHESVTLVAY